MTDFFLPLSKDLFSPPFVPDPTLVTYYLCRFALILPPGGFFVLCSFFFSSSSPLSCRFLSACFVSPTPFANSLRVSFPHPHNRPFFTAHLILFSRRLRPFPPSSCGAVALFPFCRLTVVPPAASHLDTTSHKNSDVPFFFQKKRFSSLFLAAVRLALSFSPCRHRPHL